MANYTYSQGSIDVIYPPNEKKTYTSIIVEPGCDAPPPVPGENKFASLVDGSITEVTVEDLAGVTEIKTSAFEDCRKLTKVSIPPEITKIRADAFSNATALEGVYISNLESWCNITFSNNRANPLINAHNIYLNNLLLTNITIPLTITKITNYIFIEGTSITTVNLHNNISEIGTLAFTSTGITDITIPGNVRYFNEGAFSSCNNLKNVTFLKGITSINASYLFGYCRNLETASFPDTITSMTSDAFKQCGQYTASGTIYTILATIPPTLSSQFFDGAKIKKIIVPAGTGDTYKAATNWSALADYIEEATE